MCFNTVTVVPIRYMCYYNIMGRACTICTHPLLADIEEAMDAGTTLRAISSMYAVTAMSLSRHRSSCMGRRLSFLAAKAATEGGVDTGETLPDTDSVIGGYVPTSSASAPDAYSELLSLKGILSNTLGEAVRDGNSGLIVAASRELRSTTETMLKVWETQKRIEAQYAKQSPLSATWVHGWLQRVHPDILSELIRELKEAHDVHA